MKTADIRNKEHFIKLFKEYELIRASWLHDTPLSVNSLEELAVKFLHGRNVVLDENGFVIFSNDPQEGGHIDHLYVVQNSRRKGLGKKLVLEAEKILKDRDCSLITLVNSVYNRSINEFYRNMGYSLSGESRDYYRFKKKI